MKDAFEQNLKDSLNNFEAPYSASAWEAMQARLDANTPSPSFEDKMKEGLNSNQYPYNPAAWNELSKRLDGGPKGGLKKWHVAAGIIGVAAITTFFIWNSNSETEKTTDNTVLVENQAKQQSQVAQSKDKSTDGVKKDVANNNDAANPGSDQVNLQNAGEPTNSAGNNGSSNNSSNDVASSNHAVHNNDGSGSGIADNNGSVNSNSGSGSQNDNRTIRAWKYISPAIPENVCQGENLQIKNDNTYPLVVIYPNGLNWIGGAEKVTRLNPSIAGAYQIGYMRDNEFLAQSSFVVSEAPLAEFDFVDLTQKYLKGLPTVEVRATVRASSYEWKYENGTLRGDDVDFHFYEKGIHPITLTVTNENGCSASIEKSVTVDENYNLMAMKAFVPNGINATFMPFALTERKVNFTMIILDPNDGHVLYATSDASHGWDGTDQQTGSPAEMDKSYIWKVTLTNPEPGESAIYSGTVLMLSK